MIVVNNKWERIRKEAALVSVGALAIKSKKNASVSFALSVCLSVCPCVITLETLIEFLMKSGVAEFD
jgi:hypothetical protein